MNKTQSLVAAVIPARFAAQRLPGKPLLKETGQYLIQHVYEQVCRARNVGKVIIATDDDRIYRAAESFGARAAMTSPDHHSGTDRVAEVARGLDEEVIINVQGDEPEIEPEAVEQLADMMTGATDIVMGTLAVPIESEERYHNPNVVKVVVDNSGDALYFSRASIPCSGSREARLADWPVRPLHHIGIYGFRRDFLLKFVRLPQSRLERLERLEQLRALEHGYRVRVGLRPSANPGIDTPEQYRAFVTRWKAIHPG
jgi:3-deoxy-manno-octulosonate cytidylyltransferase (CMP-KDO synthetase)